MISHYFTNSIQRSLWHALQRSNLAVSFPLLHSALAAMFLSVSLFLSTSQTSHAGSATWLASPVTGSWGTAANWTAGGPPNGPSDTATFDGSTITTISISRDTEVNGIVFNADASPFTIAARSGRTLTISGTGITNNSGIAQRFVGNSLGTILFTGDSTGATAQVQLFDTGSLDVSTHNAPGVTVGSIEGSGTVNLGANNLTVDSNYQSTVFSGVIQDSGAGGSLTKLGQQKLIFSNANTYSGGTTVSGGILSVTNQTGSATGSGAVDVVAGGLAGDGIIAGPVSIGTGSAGGPTAVLQPGEEGVLGTLTFLSMLTFNSRGGYFFDVISAPEPAADQVIANGVTIRTPGTNLFIHDRFIGTGALKTAELYDAGSGTWSATDSLSTARAGHTATLLPNGKVLVAGGDAVGSAELYDPGTGHWTPTGSFITTRGDYTATLLLDGKVLVAGGNHNGFRTATAELYDPATGVWTATGQLAVAREAHTATLLQNGKVLVAGGIGNGIGLRSAELYDPATGTWFNTGNQITSRWSHTATLLSNGKVLVAGGSTGIGIPTAKSELYDPATGTWTATGNLHNARQVHSAALLLDGKVLVAGGQGLGGNDPTSAELYDLASGTWTLTGSLAIPRSYYTATLLLNGKVMAAGGNNGINFTEASVELYDPAIGTWTTTGSLDPGRYSHTATLLPDGKVLVAGGVGMGLVSGTIITLINNTSATPISGRFSNLPDGSIVTVAGKDCQVSYSGGDGNDLTLTVLP
jgi:autotransporter-associated beta strand protein